MLGVAEKCSKTIRTKGVSVIKARFGAYRTVIEGVKDSKDNYIFVFDPKCIFYNDTHEEKREQGYKILKHNLLTGSENLQIGCYRKAVVYISVETEQSTYEDRGEALSHFLQFLTEHKKIRPIHLVFHQYDLYPIPHMEQFLKESAKYHIHNSIVVESHSKLQRIYGKKAAQRIITSCQTTVLA
ncbi:TraM recognition domain-containing protein [Bacillus sp. GB_SG_008]|uniref:TraM recognition domain-containing protein n=1 Tax=Bacillus sp. GB_SG_008 TaxID=3454627 RepID=UPI003F866767